MIKFFRVILGTCLIICIGTCGIVQGTTVNSGTSKKASTSISRSNPAAQKAAQWIARMQSKNGLVKSYDNPKEDYAWTYDQALAILVFTRTDLKRATLLVDRMSKLQNKDGSWYDGYIVTSMDSATDNKWIGSMSWMVYAICQYIDHGGDTTYFQSARKCADWLLTQEKKNGSLHESTEGNLDSWWAFQAVGYTDAANKMKTYLLENVWDEQEGRFIVGTNNRDIYLDPQSWGSEFLKANGENKKAQRALQFAYDKLTVSITLSDTTYSKKSTAEKYSGFDTAGPYTIWIEGTAQYVSANGINAKFYLHELDRQQNKDGSMFHSPENFEKPGVWHVRWPGVAATAWFYIAHTGSPYHTGLCRAAK